MPTSTNLYDPEVWTQVSRRFHTVARLPEGVTAVAALQAADSQGAYKAPYWQREEAARNQYLRVHAPKADRRGPAEWELYLRAGGGSAGTNTAAMKRYRAHPNWRMSAAKPEDA